MYWIGPLLGGVCASLIYQLSFKAPPRQQRVAVAAAEGEGEREEQEMKDGAADP